MRTPSAHDLIDLWEWGQAQSPARRALGVLAVAFPDVPAAGVAAASVGRRDRALLAVRETVFGRTLCSLADCPSCRQAVEVNLDTEQLHGGTDERPQPAEVQPPLSFAGFEVRWKLPDSRDLFAAEAASGLDEAREVLLRRTVLAASCGSERIEVEELPTDVLAEVSAAMERADPLGRIEFPLSCPRCECQWLATLDVAAFLWGEIEATARRLLHEVHVLASAYGWREADVLAMGERRRWAYLEMIGG
jgi:hypothetical protein